MSVDLGEELDERGGHFVEVRQGPNKRLVAFCEQGVSFFDLSPDRIDLPGCLDLLGSEKGLHGGLVDSDRFGGKVNLGLVSLCRCSLVGDSYSATGANEGGSSEGE